MRKQNKKIKLFLFVLFICTINISVLSAADTFWETSYEQPETNNFSLKEINITNLYQAVGTSSTLKGYGTYHGYYAGTFTIDFNTGTFETDNKRIISTSEGNYYFGSAAYWDATNRTSISDESGNHSRVSCFIHIYKYEGTSIVDNIWYDITKSNYFDYYNDNSFFQDIKTNKLEFEYFYVLDDKENLKPNETWTLFVPLKSDTEFPKFSLKIADDWNSGASINNEVYNNTGLFTVENASNIDDIYSLNVDIQKKFNDENDFFFNGQIHDYYSLDFDSYKYGVLTEEPFSICLEISSAHNWYLYLDNEENPSTNEQIAYELYLKYKSSSSYSSILIGPPNPYKILIKNIKSSNASSIIYLQTKCENAQADFNTKGEYQDTVYLNFITDGWTNENEDNFAEKTITLQ